MSLLTTLAAKLRPATIATAPAAIPVTTRAIVNITNEPLNESANVSAASIQDFLRQAEFGQTRWLFALYRDISGSGSHILAELSKRKLAVLSEPCNIMPADKSSRADQTASRAAQAMIDHCENWQAGLSHLLDGTIWPLAITEKIFTPAQPGDTLPSPLPSPPSEGGEGQGEVAGQGEVEPRFWLKRLEPVNPVLFCFRHLFGTLELKTDPDQWEHAIRLFGTTDDGAILWDLPNSYPLDRLRHAIYRGHLLTGQRDHWGGPMRACLFWWFLAANGRDWFGRAMERIGTPFPVAKTDSKNPQAVQLLRGALSLSTRLGGLVVDRETEVELIEAATSNLADAHEKFLNVCNREISKVIVGQSGSEVGHSQGLGSGMAKAQETVRSDIKLFDRIGLGECVEKQIIAPFLQINGLTGRVKVTWGGLEPDAAQATGKLLLDLSQAGLEPTDQALPTLSEKVGFELQRKAIPPIPPIPPITPLRASALSLSRAHPSDTIAARQSAILAAAYRGSLAPVRQIILSAPDPETALRHMTAFFSDWSPAKINQVTEEALQLCAAAGSEVRGQRPEARK